MKTVLFVPGFREDIKSRDYKTILATIESKGYKVVFVPINWLRTTIEDWTKQLDEAYKKCDPAQTILAGFSYGAMTAFMSASKNNPSELWLFSLSPYFSDDIPDMKRAWLIQIGRRRADSFRKLDFNELAKNISCKTVIMIGTIEAAKYPLLDTRSKLAHQNIADSALIVISNSDHDVSDKNYVAAIKKTL